MEQAKQSTQIAIADVKQTGHEAMEYAKQATHNAFAEVKQSVREVMCEVKHSAHDLKERATTMTGALLNDAGEAISDVGTRLKG